MFLQKRHRSVTSTRGRLPRGKISLTALLLGLIRPVLAVLHRVAHLGAVDALSVLTQELQGSLTFGSCIKKKEKETQQHFYAQLAQLLQINCSTFGRMWMAGRH